MKTGPDGRLAKAEGRPATSPVWLSEAQYGTGKEFGGMGRGLPEATEAIFLLWYAV